MPVLDDLKRLSAAEEFFALLGVDYDPKIVSVARLHILRRMGQYLATTDLSALDEDAARAAARAQLEKAYADFVEKKPIDERVFKVLKDAVAPKGKPAFVSLASLTAKG